MAPPRKYPDELRDRAIRMVVDARTDPATRPNACRRIGARLGIHHETLRGWVARIEIDAGRRPGTTSVTLADPAAAAARAFARVAADLRAAGRKPAARSLDAMIAATALSRALTVHTCASDLRAVSGLEVVEVPHPHR